MGWKEHPRWRQLAARLRAGKPGLLMLDYDGTLAPFHRDPSQAVPYSWVDRLLNELQGAGTRVVLVTGRSVASLLEVYPNAFELWGSHGAEHRVRGEGIQRVPLPDTARQALDALELTLVRRVAEPLGAVLERKPYGLAIPPGLAGPPSRRKMPQSCCRSC
jgi:trehalose-phosphatase